MANSPDLPWDPDSWDSAPVVEPSHARPKPFVTVSHGLRGWFAVLMWFNDEDDVGNKIEGFWEPWQSGIGSYKTPEGAEREAREWAQDEGLEFRHG